MKVFHFVSGIPRSGSTLLCNILAQNPRFFATPTSGLCPLLFSLQHAWSDISELQASSSTAQKIAALTGLMEGFHSSVSQPVVLDKSRGWVAAFELLENILGHKPKILVTYRDIPSVLSSCEKLFRRELANPASTAKFAQNMEKIEGRLEHWSDGTQLIGGNFNRIRDCVARGHRASMHFIHFDNLTSRPKETMQAAYAFLGEEYFPHDFENVEQATHEKDEAHGFVDLHTIRAAVRPVKKDYREILGDAVKPYLNVNFNFIQTTNKP